MDSHAIKAKATSRRWCDEVQALQRRCRCEPHAPLRKDMADHLRSARAIQRDMEFLSPVAVGAEYVRDNTELGFVWPAIAAGALALTGYGINKLDSWLSDAQAINARATEVRRLQVEEGVTAAQAYALTESMAPKPASGGIAGTIPYLAGLALVLYFVTRK